MTESDKNPLEMTAEEFQAWLDEPDPEPPPPSAYPLGSFEGRCGFLEAYIWRGDVALFESVSHIWKSLLEPKGLHCALIGVHAGTGGSGKWALAKFLKRALREALDYDVPPPWHQSYSDIDTLHAAATEWFAADYKHYERTVQKYADILGGEPGRHTPHSAEIIKGPWLALEGPRDLR